LYKPIPPIRRNKSYRASNFQLLTVILERHLLFSQHRLWWLGSSNIVRIY